MSCGLANRMFQYAFYLWLKQQGENALVDYYQSVRLAHEKVEWNQIFPNATFEKCSKLEAALMGGGSDLFSRFFRKYFITLTKVMQMPTAFDAFSPVDKKKHYIFGVFQNANMVECVGNIRNILQFSDFTDKKNIQLVEKLSIVNSVGIHVRKGSDYNSRIWYQNTCEIDYYNRAIDYITNHVNDPVFFVFTDNKEWVNKHLRNIKYILVDHNPTSGFGSHFDMQLMSLCRHNIISNSTYSWWGAYLNKYCEKIVICPEIWFNPESCEEFKSDRLLCKNWIAL